MTEAGGIGRNAGIVLSGGGVYAAYEVGVMRAILGGETQATGFQALDPGIVTGTSAGGLNAALLVSQLDNGVRQALDYLENVWLDELAAPLAGGANGVFRFRFDPTALFTPGAFAGDPLRPFANLVNDGASITGSVIRRGWNLLLSTGTVESRAVNFADLASLISTDPLARTLRRVVDLNAVRQSKRILRVAATNWTSGEVRVFTNPELAGEDGYLALQGSAAIPGIFPPVTIGNDAYVDGGLIMNTPLKPAIDAGASELHVIYLDPQVKNIPINRLGGTLEVFERALAIGFAATTRRDIEVATMINAGIRLGTMGGARTQNGPAPKAAAQLAGRLEAREGRTPIRPITIHRYHPADDLGSGLSVLDFSRGTIQRLIERGLQDGIRHDCEASECVLP